MNETVAAFLAMKALAEQWREPGRGEWAASVQAERAAAPARPAGWRSWTLVRKLGAALLRAARGRGRHDAGAPECRDCACES